MGPGQLKTGSLSNWFQVYLYIFHNNLHLYSALGISYGMGHIYRLWFIYNNRPKIIASSCFQCVRLVVLCVRAWDLAWMRESHAECVRVDRSVSMTRRNRRTCYKTHFRHTEAFIGRTYWTHFRCQPRRTRRRRTRRILDVPSRGYPSSVKSLYSTTTHTLNIAHTIITITTFHML